MGEKGRSEAHVAAFLAKIEQRKDEQARLCYAGVLSFSSFSAPGKIEGASPICSTWAVSGTRSAEVFGALPAEDFFGWRLR